MIKTIVMATSMIAVMAVLGGVQAQTVNSNSNADSTSGASSRSGSSSRASVGGNQTQGTTTNTGVTLNQSSTSPANTSTGVNYSGGTSNYSTERSTGDVVVRTTPTVYAPPVSGGNPCTLAVSGGVSVIGWGAAAGGTFVDEACATRQKIAMIHNAGYAGAAKELMCDDRATYNAFKTAGQPCAFRQGFEQPGAAPSLPATMPVRTTSVQPAPVMQPAGRFVCLDNRGREVSAGTPGASCGQI